jgi:transposase-like protein
MIEPQGPSISMWRHFAPEVILCAAHGWLRYSLSFRDVQELLVGRGLDADHATVGVRPALRIGTR